MDSEASGATPIIVALIGFAGTVVSAILMRPGRTGRRRKRREQTRRPRSVSLVLGVLALVAWLLPLVGLPLSLVGIGLGVSHLGDGVPAKLERTGVVLNVVGLMAATANAAVGAYVGYLAGVGG